MARRPDPQFLRGEVSHRLRHFRDTARITQEEAAERMDWSISKLIRIENANVGISTNDLRALLALYGVHDQVGIENLVTMAKDGRRQPWHSKYSSVLNAQFRTLLAYESYASRIEQVQPLLVPGLLQTESYARALLASVYAGDQLALAVEARAARQHQILSDSPELIFLIDQAVIYRMVGGPDVMRGQLTALLDAMPDSATIRIMPFSAGTYPGLVEPFLLLHLDDDLGTGVTRVVFLENPRSDYLIHDDDVEIAAYGKKWEAMLRQALSKSDSVKLIQEQIGLLGSD
ncbi:MAG TPA: helix-turn-helix transcriptional regulator [Pseudonocardiaceae bacterium]|jgi:transcriptional regulator with XRE-family HTH domain|nr:helix-turn-helix transcriptional regulator [Pseudonocardiaceae bacterium]